MKKIVIVSAAVLALGLGACKKNDADNTTANETVVENNADADVNAADVNTTAAADNALNVADNAVANAQDAVSNAKDAVKDADKDAKK